jgi:hypothetical protein
MVMSEVVVILKDSERTYRQKFLSYSEFTVNENDSYILKCVEEAKKNFDGEPEEVVVKITLEIVS